MDSIEKIYTLLTLHMLGDYVLQIDFLAKTKGTNWWHMLAHCLLYTGPFAVVFGFDWRVLWLLATHLVIDALKARWDKISYSQDQALHVIAMGVYFI